MLIQDHKELKTFVSALRRELKPLMADPSALSHAACLELAARAFGSKTYAALALRLPEARPKAPKVPEQPPYPLKNLHGIFDLVPPGEAGIVVRGVDFLPTHGTIEDIEYCTALVNSGSRADDGSLVPEYAGETKVNWDGQVVRVVDGVALWDTEDCEAVFETACILVPEDFDGPDHDDCLDLPNRPELIDAHLELAQQQGLVAQLHAELTAPDGAQSPKLAELSATVGFALHLGEIRSLHSMLGGRL